MSCQAGQPGTQVFPAPRQAVYLDLRGLQGLYRFHVEAARVTTVLPAVDLVLTELCQATWPDLHAGLARALLGALAQAVLRILLHGGPQRCEPATSGLRAWPDCLPGCLRSSTCTVPCRRWFIPEDSGLLREGMKLLLAVRAVEWRSAITALAAAAADLDQVVALFHSDGDGLPKQAILQDMSRLYGLLDVMSLDTSTLIAKYRVHRKLLRSCCPFMHRIIRSSYALFSSLHILTVLWHAGSACRRECAGREGDAPQRAGAQG
jgi:hypothetical protein